MDFTSFVSFYNDYTQRHPDASLKTVTDKFIAGHSLCDRKSSFGATLHLNRPALALNEAAPFGDICDNACARFRGVDGNVYFYKIVCPETSDNDPSAETSRQLNDLLRNAEAREQQSAFQLIENQTLLLSAPDGTYTYIVVSLDEQVFLFGTRTSSLSEVVSKHRHLLHRALEQLGRSDRIVFHYAGEMRITSTAVSRLVEFNFMSGTFMKRASAGNEAQRDLYAPELIQTFTRLAGDPRDNPAQSLKRSRRTEGGDENERGPVEFRYNDTEFITNKAIITPYHIVFLYILAGFTIMVFDHDCNQFSSSVQIRLARQRIMTDYAIKFANSTHSAKSFDTIRQEYEAMDPSVRPAPTFDEYFYNEYVRKKTPSEPEYLDIAATELRMKGTVLAIDDPRIQVRCSRASAGAGGAAAAADA